MWTVLHYIILCVFSDFDSEDIVLMGRIDKYGFSLGFETIVAIAWKNIAYQEKEASWQVHQSFCRCGPIWNTCRTWSKPVSDMAKRFPTGHHYRYEVQQTARCILFTLMATISDWKPDAAHVQSCYSFSSGLSCFLISRKTLRVSTQESWPQDIRSTSKR